MSFLKKPLCIVAATLMATAAFAQDTEKPVKLMDISVNDQTFSRIFFGKVVARQSVDLAFQVGGQINEFPVVEGQMVKEGNLIAQLEQEPFSLALERAVVQKDQAERTLERLTKLRGNTVSQVTLDDANTQVNLSDIALRQAETNLNHATLYAPFDALIATRNVDNYVTTAAGKPVVRLHDMSEIRIEFDVPEILFQTASREENVSFMAHFPGHDEPLPADVREFNAEAATAGQTYRITLGLEPRDDLQVLPGSSVSIHVSADHKNPGIMIPATAIVVAPDGALSVMRFVSDNGDNGTLEATPVEVKPASNGDFELVSGLKAGDVIVSAGASATHDGEAVRRFTGYSN